jgi:NAD+ kinase
MIKSIAILEHPKKPATHDFASHMIASLHKWNVKTHRAHSWDTPKLEKLAAKVDLIVVLGGDGSTLRAARVAAPKGIPVASVNFGRLGFLSEMTPENWREQLPKFLSGDYWIEERMMLSTEVRSKGKVRLKQEALNDVVVGRGSLARVIRAETFVDQSPLTTYSCDGLIVATPTGSTAYALAAGGPVLPPSLRNIVLVPIAPHLSLDKPVVLSQGSVVEVIVHTDHTAGMSADGQSEVVLKNEDRVIVRASDHVAKFARVQPPTYFYRTLMSRLKG